jgi:hypothetical protein
MASVPLIKIIGGTFGLLIPPEQLYRFIFTAPAYAFIPYITILIIQKTDINDFKFKYYKELTYSLTNILLLIIIIFISSFTPYQNMYRNSISMYNLLDKKKTDSYDKNTIEKLKQIVDEQTPKDVKYPVYYLRGDMAMVLHYYYGKFVFTMGKSGLLKKSDFFRINRNYKRVARTDSLKYKLFEKISEKFYLSDKQLIDIILPENFPAEQSIFKHFRKMNKNYLVYSNKYKPNGIIGELTGKKKIFQAIPTVEAVSGVELFMATFGKRKNNKTIIVQVMDSKGNILAETQCNASEIKDNKWHSFVFDKSVKLDPKAKYNYIIISSPDSYHGNAVTIYKTKCSWGYRINGKWVNASLKMKIYTN